VRPYHFSTTTATPALTQLQGEAVALLGITATSAESAGYFVKIWWAHNSGTEIPVIGTTAPDLTIEVGTGGICQEFNHPLQGGGPAWVSVTKNAADTDATALTTGGDVITLFLD
jgi:hypothetical protein